MPLKNILYGVQLDISVDYNFLFVSKTYKFYKNLAEYVTTIKK